MSGPVDDKIECLECGDWFRSVANHVYQAHGLRADEYRLRHDIAMNDPLCGADTLNRKVQAAHNRLEADPGLMERMWARRVEPEARRDQARSEARAAAMARRSRAVEAQWEEALARQGWSSWQDAADWAIDKNVGWAEVGALLGWSERPVQARAQLAGVPMLDRRITPRQEQMLVLARNHFGQAGTLLRAKAPLSEWLSSQRRLAARGLWRRVHLELDQIDPDWALDPAQRSNPPCSVPGCETPRESQDLCRTHYHRKLNKERRDAVIDRAEQVECLECGERFRAVGTHVRHVHGLSAAEYRARHGIADATAMNAAAVRAKRQQHSDRPESKEQFRQAQIARWGGTIEELWSKRFERVGWSGWDDVVAWATEHNAGWAELADRLGCSKNTVRRGGESAGIEILPPMTDKQLEFLELAPAHVAEHGDLTQPQPAELAHWLTSTRDVAKKAKPRNRCYLALDEIDPEWRIPGANRTDRA